MAPAHIIVPDDGQQAAMPDNEQRFHQRGQIGEVLDKLLKRARKREGYSITSSVRASTRLAVQ